MGFGHSAIPSSLAIPASASTAEPHTQIRTQPQPHRTTVKFRSSKSFPSARKAATLEIQRSSDLPSTLARLGEALTVKDLNAVLYHFKSSNKFNHISQLFKWMQENNKIDVSSYSHYMRFMANNLDAAEMLQLYHNIQDESARKNTLVCNSVLGCLIKKGKFDSGMKLFQQMQLDGLVPDLVTYSTLLAGCIKIENGYPKALELIQELQHNKLQMDGVIYGTILAVCASNSKWEEAEKYFNQMKDEGHSPNVYHYSSLLNAYSTCGSYKKADMLIQDMKSEGLVPNKVILTTLLKVYVKGGLFDKSRELLAELKSLGYAEDEMPYCILMDGLAKAGKIHEAKVIFDEMMKNHVRSDGYAHSIMISALCRAKLFREAKQLAKDFETTSNKYDLVILNSMLCAFCRVGEMESVMETLKKMDELAISPSYNTFHILIKYFCREKMYLLAYRTMKDMHTKGHQPGEELCSSLISHLGQVNAYSEAFSVYNMLRYGKRTMCKSLHEKILYILLAGHLLKDAYVVVKDNAKFISRPATKKFAIAFMKSGNINYINDVLKTLHDSGYELDQDLFAKAVSRYLDEPEKKDLLLHLLQWMPGQGYVVDSSTRNLILKNSHLFGRQLIAEVLSKQRVQLKHKNLTR
ncbi:nucleobase:cation symporter-1 [Vigna unguiculata]|uniref:Nucleobase:cation symporter-1 n=1 Tax=Vigna unguiculata TaxID=3917 RepID=A0A4D6KH06_VIGUN|nr:nucleobase:cation symporter-1 [Vigna unguiculata]